MLAAPEQGDLMDALDAVAKDVDFRLPFQNQTGGDLIAQNCVTAVRRLLHFFKELIEKVP